MFAGSRTLLSVLLIVMALAVTRSPVDAKLVKSKQHKLSAPANLATAANDTLSSGSSVNGTGRFFTHGKRGLSGGDSMKWLVNDIAWFTDWTPDPFARNEIAKNAPNVEGVAMLWGLGRLDHDDDKARFQAFQQLKCGQYPFVTYLNEFDFQGNGSSGVIEMADAVAGWEKYIVPHRQCGSKLIGPSCALQLNEKMCTQWVKEVTTKPDAISVHIFKDSVEGVKEVVDHYRTLKFPMVITELACINYEGPTTKYCSQEDINIWWPGVVSLLDGDDDVVAYAASDAFNGPHSSLTISNGKALSVTGELLHRLWSTPSNVSTSEA